MHRIRLLVYESLAPRNRYRTSCAKAPAVSLLASHASTAGLLVGLIRVALRAASPRAARAAATPTQCGSWPRRNEIRLHTKWRPDRPRRDSGWPASVCGEPGAERAAVGLTASVEAGASDRAGRSSLAAPRRRSNRATPGSTATNCAIGFVQIRTRLSRAGVPVTLRCEGRNRPETTLRFWRVRHPESNGRARTGD